jgi:DNA polymerase-3 subunit alpha
VAEPELPDVKPWAFSELLAHEKEILNFYVSGHPLDHFRDEIQGFASVRLRPEELAGLKDGQPVTVAGMITGVRNHVQKDGKPMAFAVLEDFDGQVELLVFGDAFAKHGLLLAPNSMVLAHGQVAVRESETGVKLRVENMMALSESRERLTRSVHVKIRTQGLEPEFLRGIAEECAKGQGECGLVIHLVTQEENEYRVRSRKCRISADPRTIDDLRSKLGKENVWLSKAAA